MNTNWKTLLEQLSQAFPKSEIQWRAGAVTRDKKRAQALPYAEPRAYEDRLNDICPGDWSVKFSPWGEKRIICELTINGVTRSSTGEDNDGFAPGTAAEAQAFKRACSKFGLGRYMYDVPIQWVDYDEERSRLKETPEMAEEFLPIKVTNPLPLTTQDHQDLSPRKPLVVEKGANVEKAVVADQSDKFEVLNPEHSHDSGGFGDLVPRTPATDDSGSSGFVTTKSQALDFSSEILSPERAKAMGTELEKLGYPKREQLRLASSVLEKPVRDLTQLSDSEAFEVWSYAKRVSRQAA
jgi:hypothetical protein